MNFCRSCGADFASVTAFDRHRVGVHAYTYTEGLDFDIPREDGRRCMDADEMWTAGMEPDKRGRWRIGLSHTDQARLAALREAA